jgi:hypothetical protein
MLHALNVSIKLVIVFHVVWKSSEHLYQITVNAKKVIMR